MSNVLRPEFFMLLWPSAVRFPGMLLNIYENSVWKRARAIQLHAPAAVQSSTTIVFHASTTLLLYSPYDLLIPSYILPPLGIVMHGLTATQNMSKEEVDNKFGCKFRLV